LHEWPSRSGCGGQHLSGVLNSVRVEVVFGQGLKGTHDFSGSEFGEKRVDSDFASVHVPVMHLKSTSGTDMSL
jgi:hypothetical protein